MNLDSVRSIVNAEQEAEKVKENARLKIIDLKKESIEEQKRMKMLIEEYFQKQKKEILQEAIDNSQDEVQKILEEANEKCKKIEQKMRSKQIEAIESVVKKVGI